jgi:hypothetical protein
MARKTPLSIRSYKRKVKIFRLKEDILDFSNPALEAVMALNRRYEIIGLANRNYNKSRQYNYSWCPLDFTIINTGSKFWRTGNWRSTYNKTK